jgi:hypothetical protein
MVLNPPYLVASEAGESIANSNKDNLNLAKKQKKVKFL